MQKLESWTISLVRITDVRLESLSYTALVMKSLYDGFCSWGGVKSSAWHCTNRTEPNRGKLNGRMTIMKMSKVNVLEYNFLLLIFQELGNLGKRVNPQCECFCFSYVGWAFRVGGRDRTEMEKKLN